MERNCLNNTVKILLIPLIILLVFVTLEKGLAQAQVVTSQTINFQGKIVRNDSGYEGLNVTAGSPACVVAGSGNDTCDFRVTYFDVSSSGTALLTEVFSNVEIGEYGGVFNLALGSIQTSLIDIISQNESIYVQVEFAPDGSTYTETFTRMPLRASGYSMYSKYAGGANDAFEFSQSISSVSSSNPVAGMVYYSTASNTLKLYNGTSWIDLADSGSVGGSYWVDESISSWTWSNFMETGGIGALSAFSLDTTDRRVSINGTGAKSGLSVYSSYSNADDNTWPLVSFKADSTSFRGTILELVQDSLGAEGKGKILVGKRGTDTVFEFDNSGNLHLTSNGIAYFEAFGSLPASYGGYTGEGCFFNVNGTPYWNSDCTTADGNGYGTPVALALGGGSLWTDGGAFTYLTATGDDLILGANTIADATFLFDVDASGGSYFEVDNADNSSRLFTIDSSGNVGIGTATPSAKLEIAGATSTISNTTGDITINPASFRLLVYGSIEIPVTTQPVPVSLLTTDYVNSDRILMGMDPDYLTSFTFVGTTNGTNGNMMMGSFSNSGGNFVGMRRYGAYYTDYGLYYDWTNSAADLYTGMQIYDDELAIIADGTELLYVDGYNDELRIGSGVTLNWAFSDADKMLLYGTSTRNKISTLYGYGTGYYAGEISTSTGNEGYHAFYTDVAGVWSEAMRITADGNVGIGTTSITQRLEVSGNIRLSGSIYSTYNESIVLANHGNGNVSLSALDGNLYLGYYNTGAIYFYGGGSSKMFLSSNGNVGIGTTSPAYNLDVVSNIRSTSRFTAKTVGAYGSANVVSGNTSVTGYFEWRLPANDGLLGTRLGYMGWNSTDVALNLENGADFLVNNGKFGVGMNPGTAGYGSIVAAGPMVSIFSGSNYMVNSVMSSTPSGYPGWSVYSVEGYRTSIFLTSTSLYWAGHQSSASPPNRMYLNITNGNLALDGAVYNNYWDLAEYTKTKETDLEAGDVVSFDSGSKETIVGTKNASTVPAGVISTAPGLVMGNGSINENGGGREKKNDPSWKLLALVGQVPAKITLKPGESIEVNDYLSVSDVPRYATKQKKAGVSLGRVTESFDPSKLTCKAVSSISQIKWPVDKGHNENKPCFVLPDGTYIGKVMLFINVSWYEPLEVAIRGSNATLNSSAWYRIAQTTSNNASGIFKLTNNTLGTYQNIEFSAVKGSENSINIKNNMTSSSDIFTQARYITENGTTYLEIYVEGDQTYKVSANIEENNGWSTVNWAKSPYKGDSEVFTLSGISFNIDRTLSVSQGLMKVTGDVVTSGQSNLGSLEERWSDIYASGSIRLGNSGSEGSIRYNVEKHTLEFSNNGVDWISLRDLKSQNTLSPEYPGAVLYADGTDNYGTMTSDVDDVESKYLNYYQWTSELSTLQDYDILVRITLPDDFVSWNEEGITLDFVTENSASVENNKVDLYLYGSETNQSSDVESKDNISKLAGQWQRISLKGSEIDKCDSAGETCVLKINMSSKDNYYVRVGDIVLNYNRSL